MLQIPNPLAALVLMFTLPLTPSRQGRGEFYFFLPSFFTHLTNRTQKNL
jgi:hypothetical protein